MFIKSAVLKHLIGLLALSIATNLAQAQATRTGVSEHRILVGQSASFSGSFAGQAAAYRQGAQLVFNEVNQEGGIFGRTIELLSVDDGYNAERALANTRAFIQHERVFALFGYTWTNTVKAAIPLAEAAKVPFVAPYTGYDELYASNSPEVFTVRASFEEELNAIVRHLHTIGLTRISLVRYDSQSGNELLSSLGKQLAANHMELVGVGVMKTNSENPAAAVSQLKDTNPQAIILGASGRDAAAFVRAFDKATHVRQQYFARSLIGAEQLEEELGPLAVGISITELAPNPFRATAPIAKDYRKHLEAADLKAAAGYIGLEGFIAARIFVAAIRRAGPDLTREKLVAALETMKTEDIGGYLISMGPGNHNGSHYVDLTFIGSGGRVFD